ncbi:hypothetical protein [Erwinia sp.]|uniref:hypothetical protein n=1 Tax=Erwinia citreus TaxID=558 RepID=UPI00289979F2|nr:hypothetical protein [Erwinia sp.]
MRKSRKILVGIVVVLAAVFIYAWPYIGMDLAGSANYTEQDSREYNFYTPEILKSMPRISSSYDFDYANITGPSAHVYAIKFHNTSDTKEVGNYLNSKGYDKQRTCHIKADCWQGKDPKEVITVSVLTDPDTVLVAVNQSF